MAYTILKLKSSQHIHVLSTTWASIVSCHNSPP